VSPPLVVTLLLDDAAQAVFDRLRAAHFPPERNHLGAHVTLFHALPGEHEGAVRAELATAARVPAFGLVVSGPRLLGRGVALDVGAPELDRLHRRLRQSFGPWLTRQDAQRLRAHVTVQNKVEPAVARALRDELAAAPLPTAATARGLGLWRYLGGPWEPLAEFGFAGF
jgi:hypothetical protein